MPGKLLGIKAVITKSFARIHRANLINFGILPLTFSSIADYDTLEQGEVLEMPQIRKELTDGKPITVKRQNKGDIIATYKLTDRERCIVLAGGLLNYTKGER